MASAATAKSVAAGKVKKASAAPKKPRAHPPYVEMITEAIAALKERSGSSQVAIAKFIEDKQKELPPNFRKLLLNQLKKLVESGKLTKVKNSFKLAGNAKSAAAADKPKAAVAKPAAESKKRKAPTADAPTAKPKAAATKKVVAVKPKPKASTPVKKTATKAKAVKKTPVKKVALSKLKKTPVKKPKSIKSPVKKARK